MTFFKDFPIPKPPPRGRTVRFVPPPWAGAPRYELPAVVHIGQFLHHTPTRMLAIKSAEVFSTGCTFDLTWIIRRSNEDDEEWAGGNAAFFQHGSRLRAGQNPFDALLLFGVQLPDGSRASTGSTHGRGPSLDQEKQPAAPVLAFQGQGGGGGDDEMAGSGTLWLWPLPPEGDLRLVAQWKELAFEESSLVLDGGRLRAASAGVQRFWREDQAL
jgi:hypothetical protein